MKRIDSKAGGANRRKPLQQKGQVYPIPDSKTVTLNEKLQLGQMIKKLPSEYLQQVCYIATETT